MVIVFFKFKVKRNEIYGIKIEIRIPKRSGDDPMGMTLAEKILSEHAGKEVRAGEIIVVNVDLAYTQDGTGPLAVRKIQEMGFQEVFNPKKNDFFP